MQTTAPQKNRFFDLQNVDTSDFARIFDENFGYKPDEDDLESGKVLAHFVLQGVPIDLQLNFFDSPSKDLPSGRIGFYASGKKQEGVGW